MDTKLSTLPEYRALMMYDHLPDGCTSFMCADDYSLPHIRPGEFVVVDTTDRTPRDGEVYVIHWSSGRRNICQARRTKPMQHRSPGETAWKTDRLWTVGSLKRIMGRAAIEGWLEEATEITRRTGVIQQFPGWSDGWFGDDHLESKFLGCVIGLYAPAFEEPQRVVGRAS